ncbi:MAG: DUF285 domain-containing protein [Clostridia bacterium]|nr:DUF285 domain-containing protein [Clostridia bacterium]
MQQNRFLINTRIVNSIGIYDYFPTNKFDLEKTITYLINDDIYDLNCIDVSKITDMSFLFSKIMVCTTKNIDISNWNVSNVEDMSHMFTDYHNFNCDISNWNVSNVKNMDQMFKNCIIFNQDLSNWDVSNVEDMSYMFYNCKKFNFNINNWNISKVKSDKQNMFYKCNLSSYPTWYVKSRY